MPDGSMAENELVDWLHAHNYAPVRSPASGTKDIPQPDVAALSQHRTYGIEVNPEYADMARARVGLAPRDPSNVRDNDDQQGLEVFTDD